MRGRSAAALLAILILLPGCENYSADSSPPQPFLAPTPMVTAGARKSAPPAASFNTESYAARSENAVKSAQREPLSTFSIDVDTASYANLRRFVRENEPAPPGASS